MSSNPRRNFLKSVAAVPASAAFPAYTALASPPRKQVKITDVKAMVVNGNTPWNMVKIETDSGFTGLGEAYWGHGVKDVILGYLRPLMLGEDPLNVEPLYTKMVLSTGGAGSLAGSDGDGHQWRGDRLVGPGGKDSGRSGVHAAGRQVPRRLCARIGPASRRTSSIRLPAGRMHPRSRAARWASPLLSPPSTRFRHLPKPWHATPDRLYGLPTTHLTQPGSLPDYAGL